MHAVIEAKYFVNLALNCRFVKNAFFLNGLDMTYTTPNLQKSALITIDTQCDVAIPGAAYEIPGTMDVTPKMTSLLMTYRQIDLPIIHIVRLYRADGSNVDICRRRLIEEGESILAPNSDGAELVATLKPNRKVRLDARLLLRGEIQAWSKREVVIYKPRWSAFYQTPLDRYLRSFDIDTLVICGCNFPNCPRATIYEASARDYRLVVVADAVSGIYTRAKKELRNIGVKVWTTDKVVKKLESNCRSASKNINNVRRI
jgi:nicotinamidase-related amidase